MIPITALFKDHYYFIYHEISQNATLLPLHRRYKQFHLYADRAGLP